MIYSQTGFEPATDIDLETGVVYQDDIDITCQWVVDSPEVTETVVVAEYPNGGKDIETRVIEPEHGHWQSYDDIPSDLVNVPEDYPHDMIFTDTVSVERYRPYTQEELDDIEANKALQEEAAKRAEFMNALPETMGSIDAAICELYEMMMGE